MIVAEYLFLVLLALVSYIAYREKNRHFYTCRDIYNKLTIGLACWLWMLLSHVVGESGLAQAIPVFRSADFRILIEALLLMTGGLFLAVGATQWITRTAAASLRATQLKKHLDFLTGLNAVVSKSSWSLTSLEEIRGLLKQFSDATSVNYYRRDDVTGGLAPAETNSIPLSDGAPQLGIFQSVIDSGLPSLQTADHSIDNSPTAILPLSALGRQMVMVVSWDQRKLVDSDLEQLLELLAAGLKARMIGQIERHTERENIQIALTDLRLKLAGAERIGDEILQISASLQLILPHDILRIAVYDARGNNVTQYSLGKGKNLLSERNKSITTNRTQLGLLFASPTIISNEELKTSSYDDDRWLVSCGATTALTLPIMAGNKTIAAITFASEQSRPSRVVAEEIASELSLTLLPLIKNDALAHQLISYNRQVLDFSDALKQLAGTKDSPQFLSQLADLLVKKMPVSYCRIWSYNSERDLLEMVAESQIRDMTKQTAETKTLSVSKTQWHKLALQTGRMMLVNQKEPRMQMDQWEMIQSLTTGMQSALIVPLMAGSDPIGVLALSEMRSWERRSFSLPDTLFVRGIAGIATQALVDLRRMRTLTLISNRLEQLEKGKVVNEIIMDLPKRMATPLTSILARTQQVIERVGNADELATRNLEIIKKQTEKMIVDVRAIQDVKREKPTWAT